MEKDFSIKEGDWVTQYSAGFWRIERLLPKYADSDYEREDRCWKKGDPIGQWALMRKGFTPKMKFRLDFDCADAAWCKPVTPEQLAAINTYFAEHPKDEEKFHTAPWQDKMAVVPVILNEMDDEAFAAFTLRLTELPERFTEEDLHAFMEMSGLQDYRLQSYPQETKTMLYMFTRLYDTDSDGNVYYCKPELRRFN